MPDISPRLSLFVPNDNTLFVTEDIAANWQAIDENVVGWLSGLASERPAAASGNAGFLFYATDTNLWTLSDGTTWETFEGPQGETGPQGPEGPLTPVAHSEILIDANYTFPANYNGLSVSPVEIDSGVDVEVPSGATWLLV